MDIRLMEKKDLIHVCEIENHTFSKPWTFEDFKKSLENDSNIYIVAQSDKDIVGYCGLWGVAGEGQINNVAVNENFRNRGIGFKMLSELISMGRNKGLSSYTLEVRISNIYAIRLYRKLGFVEAGVRKSFYDSPKEDALIMWIYE